MTNYNFRVSWCPVCNQGWVKIVKDQVSNQLFLCCTECETKWKNPEEIGAKKGTHDNFGQIVEPTIEEIKSLNWHKYIKVNI